MDKMNMRGYNAYNVTLKITTSTKLILVLALHLQIIRAGQSLIDGSPSSEGQNQQDMLANQESRDLLTCSKLSIWNI